MSTIKLQLKITLLDGDYWHTAFNGTMREAEKHFIGYRFEAINPWTGKEYLRAPVVKVEQI